MVAGPGSGKTATTVQRIRRLIDGGVSPAKIVAMTFTNAGARELEDRLALGNEVDYVPYQIRLGYSGTLHGFALKMLKTYGTAIGYGERLALIGEEAVADLIESKAKTLGCKTPLKKLLELKGKITTGPIFKEERLTDTERVLLSYHAELRESGLVDFDTILTEFHRMICVDVVAQVRISTFTHLFVDERQDSAKIDCDIYRMLPIANKFQVGDPDQSIYAFRGGRPDLMVEACRRAELAIVLEANFRSHAEICDAANALIEHNVERIHKATVSVKGPGGRVDVLPAAMNEGAEVAEVVGKVLYSQHPIAVPVMVAITGEPHTPLNEIAILARNNIELVAFREQLKANGIPVAEEAKADLPTDWALAKSLIELLVKPENDALAYFYMIAGHLAEGKSDNEARGVARDAKLAAARLGKSINAHVLFFPTNLTIDGATQFLAADLSRETMMRIATIIRRLPAGSDLLQLALAMAQDQGEQTAAVEGITVCTIHASKGREFDVVFLVGFEDEILPGNRKSDGPAQVEEARRLAYVGVTRARKQLFISYSLNRKTSWGAIEAHKPSRFIKEMGL